MLHGRKLLLAFQPILLIAILALTLTACHGRTELFRADGVAVSEEPARRTEDEGFLQPIGGAAPRYTLRADRETPVGGETWRFVFDNPGGEVTITISDPRGNVVASRELRLPDEIDNAGGGPGAVVSVPVPGGTEIRSFQATGGPLVESTALRMRLVDVQIAPRTSSDDGVRLTENGLEIGPGITVDTWAGLRSGAKRWELRSETGFLSGNETLRLTYEFDAAGEGVVEEIEAHLDTWLSGEGSGRTQDDLPLPQVEVAVGNRSFELTPRPGANAIVLYPFIHASGGDAPVNELAVETELNEFRVTGLATPGEFSPQAPLPVDLTTLLSYPLGSWRQTDYEVFRWVTFPEVLVFDTGDYAVQSRFFKRLAFFAEKEGYRGQILSDEEMRGRHGYNAHNYNAEGLARFFTAADLAAVELTEEEHLLRALAEQEGLIVRSGDGYAAGSGGILSVSRQSLEITGLLPLLLTHEALHGIYYSEQAYREQVSSIWDALSDDERRFWLLLLDGMQYDITDPYLVENEFQAYLLQQALTDVEWYLEGRSASRLRSWKPAEAAWVDRYLATHPDSFLRQAIAVSEAAHETAGFLGGTSFVLSEFRPISR